MGLIDAEEAASFWSMVAKDGDKVANLPGYASIKKVIDEKGIGLREKGKMYEVNIRANPDDFLDWDKPLAEQGQAVRDRLTSHLAAKSEERAKLSGFDNFKSDPKNFYDVGGHTFRPMNDVMADDLKKLGIPGIKYLDQGSRAAGDGSRNYVVFRDDIIDILRKYGLMAPVAGGALSQSPSVAPEQKARGGKVRGALYAA